MIFFMRMCEGVGGVKEERERDFVKKKIQDPSLPDTNSQGQGTTFRKITDKKTDTSRKK